MTEAAGDGRERSFADSPTEVYDAWVEAMRDSGIRRIIWVGGDPPPALETVDAELAVIGDTEAANAVERIVALDDAADI